MPGAAATLDRRSIRTDPTPPLRMSAKKFIAELDRRKILSDRLMVRLRDSVAEIRRPLSADELAAFLVQKQLLSRSQADDVLAGLSLSGVNLGEEDDDRPTGNESAEGSSVFASHIFSHPAPSPPPPPAEEEEILLIPLEEDQAAAAQRSDIIVDDDVPLLSAVPALDELPPAIELPDPPSRGRPGRLVADDPSESGLLEQELASPTPLMSPSAPTPTAKQQAAIRRIADKKKKGKPTKSKKQWDSPLILVGGGTLAFLALAGSTILFLLNWQSGDRKLALAREAMKSGAYPQAIEQFQDFLATSPRHAEHSLARVQLAMLRIRQAAESGEFAPALDLAESELKAIEDETAFESSRAESADLIPKIAEGLARQAEQAPPTSEDASRFVGLANKAIELWNNTNYLPKEMRDEARRTGVRDALDRVARRQQSQAALAASLREMEAALAAGKPIDAYAAHLKLLQEHPELTGETGLGEAIKKTAAAELAALRYIAEEKPAETTDLPTPWVAALAVANRTVANPIPDAAGAICVRVDGAVYGLDAASGRLLWRRYVGFDSARWPIPLGDDVVLVDSVRHELLRLAAATGKLVWRQTIGEPLGDPLLVGDRGYIPCASGRLYVLDLRSGARLGYLQTPQPLAAAPVIDRTKTRLYLAGNRASLYSLTLPDLKCSGVYFLGHAPGAIQVAPVIVMDKLAVIENNGAETCRLHLLAADNSGALARQQAERRLNGLATSPPMTTGRGLIAVTDRGQIEVYDIAAGNEGEALTPIAVRDASGAEPITRHFAVVGRNVWVADTQLTKFNIVPTGNRLPVEEIESNFAGATFDHPLTALREALIEVHRPKGRAGAVVAALDTKQGHTLWQTELAMPPAGAPIVNEVAKSLTVANAAGIAFRFDESAIRSRVQDEPLKAELAPPQPPVLTASIDLGQGRAAFCAANSEWLLLANPAANNAARWLRLESTLACIPTPLADGFAVPLAIGQVYFLSSADGSRLAAPFQPRVDTQSTVAYKPVAAVGSDGRQFVATDGGKRIFLVQRVDAPQPHLAAIKEGDVGPRPITSPLVVLGETVLAVAGDSRLVKFRLPTLESAGEANLPAPAEWGPYLAGDVAFIATVDQKLLAVPASGDARWQVPLEHGPLAGPPLVLTDSVLLAYRKGIIERRALADGKPLASRNLEHPLATGPGAFLQKLVLTASDGTILVVDQP